MPLIERPCRASSSIVFRVASGIGGRMPVRNCSPMSALSNWASEAIRPNTSSPCGVVVSTFFLKADEVDAQRPEFHERVHERLGRAGDAVVAPHQHRVDLPLRAASMRRLYCGRSFLVPEA